MVEQFNSHTNLYCTLNHLYLELVHVHHLTHTFYVHVYTLIKEGVQASGANATEEISPCGMFLLEAGKKADSIFNIPSASTHHTVRDATDDILTMIQDLMATTAVQERGRQAPHSMFHDSVFVNCAVPGQIQTHN